MSAPEPSPAPGIPATVWFLSDYGLRDEFVGVCRAAARRAAPGVDVVDLTHLIAPFDVAGGAEALARSMPHLGPGAVLAVVDPGVGGDRRGVVVEVAPGDGPRWLVGPDNGLLMRAADLAGGPLTAWRLRSVPGPSVTFDGRDLFAPAAARLCAGASPAALGDRLDPGLLVRLAPPVVEAWPNRLRTEVTWVDRFGNVQLAATADLGPVPGAAVGLAVADRPGASWEARRVAAFCDLEGDELGVVADANGRLALARREGSAAAVVDAAAGDVVELQW